MNAFYSSVNSGGVGTGGVGMTGVFELAEVVVVAV